MGLYDTLEQAGYTGIVQTCVDTPWDRALRFAPHRAPIVTMATFYAKRDGKCFQVVVERHYRNRTSQELLSSRMRSQSEVPADEYDRETAKIGPLYMHPRW